ncbi:MAG TPA: hypothetical protein VD883_03940, partial [Candidatus Omnitrophota bacterium]|nr:hypothetical protein [Candidatus Omnitrophota bacterium]
AADEVPSIEPIVTTEAELSRLQKSYQALAGELSMILPMANVQKMMEDLRTKLDSTDANTMRKMRVVGLISSWVKLNDTYMKVSGPLKQIMGEAIREASDKAKSEGRQFKPSDVGPVATSLRKLSADGRSGVVATIQKNNQVVQSVEIDIEELRKFLTDFNQESANTFSTELGIPVVTAKPVVRRPVAPAAPEPSVTIPSLTPSGSQVVGTSAISKPETTPWGRAGLYSTTALILTAVLAFITATPLWLFPLVAAIAGAVGYFRAGPVTTPYTDQTLRSHNEFNELLQSIAPQEPPAPVVQEPDQQVPTTAGARLASEFENRAKRALIWAGLERIEASVKKADTEKEKSEEEKAIAPVKRAIWVTGGIISVAVGVFFGGTAVMMAFGALLFTNFIVMEGVTYYRGGKNALAGMAAGVYNLFIGAPWHLFKGFVFGIFIAKIRAYWFPVLSYIGQLASPNRVTSFNDYMVSYVLPQFTDAEVRGIAELEKQNLEEGKSSFRTGLLALAGKIVYEVSLLGGFVEFVKKRALLFAAGGAASWLMPVIGTGVLGLGPVPFMVVGMFVSATYIIRMVRSYETARDQAIEAQAQGRPEAEKMLSEARKTLAFRIGVSFLILGAFAGLSLLGVIVPSGMFDVLGLGWGVTTPAVGYLPAQTLHFTIESVVRSGATLFVLNLKDVFPAMRQKSLVSFNQLLAARMDEGRAQAIAAALNEKRSEKERSPLLLANFTAQGVRDLLFSKNAEGADVLGTEEKLITIMAVRSVISSDTFHYLGSGLSSYERSLLIKDLDAQEKEVSPETIRTRLNLQRVLETGEVIKNFTDDLSTVPFFFATLWETVSSGRFWAKVVFGIPGMWFVQHEIAMIIAASETIGFAPLVAIVHFVEVTLMNLVPNLWIRTSEYLKGREDRIREYEVDENLRKMEEAAERMKRAVAEDKAREEAARREAQRTDAEKEAIARKAAVEEALKEGVTADKIKDEMTAAQIQALTAALRLQNAEKTREAAEKELARQKAEAEKNRAEAQKRAEELKRQIEKAEAEGRRDAQGQRYKAAADVLRLWLVRQAWDPKADAYLATLPNIPVDVNGVPVHVEVKDGVPQAIFRDGKGQFALSALDKTPDGRLVPPAGVAFEPLELVVQYGPDGRTPVFSAKNGKVIGFDGKEITQPRLVRDEAARQNILENIVYRTKDGKDHFVRPIGIKEWDLRYFDRTTGEEVIFLLKQAEKDLEKANKDLE